MSFALCLAIGALNALVLAPRAGAYSRGPFLPHVVIVGLTPAAPDSPAGAPATLIRRLGIRATVASVTATSAAPATPNERVLQLAPGETVARALRTLRGRPGVAYAVPDFVAHAAGSWFPNDPGRSHLAQGWEAMQWNLLPGAGVDAPLAWGNLLAVHRPGGRGVTVAVLDSGVAYRDWRGFRRSPDFNRTRFVKPYDFVARNRFPLDRDGHGTFVAGLVAESTNNGFGLTGLAYGASIMPVRILGADGTGDALTIARGIRYAATHGAQVINLSIEFPLDTTSADIPEIIAAIRFAHSRGVVVVAAAGNEGVEQIAYPAAAPAVISVGATTKDRCLAYYSNGGAHLDLVAPGGGRDTSLLSDPRCHPDRPLPNIFQMTFLDSSKPNRFGFPTDWYGTSMAAPHVAAAAALVIASGVIGSHPSPDAILSRLELTAQPLGKPTPNADYGYGLLDAGAATAPGAVTAPAARRR